MQQTLNLLDNPGATRQELEICVGQLERGEQTGPRQEGDRDGVPSSDWSQTPGQGADDPTRAGLPWVEDSWGGQAGKAEMR